MQKILFPMKYLNITTGVKILSHLGTNALDNAGSDKGIDNVHAPFTGIIKKKYANGNTVWLESVEPVIYADGTIDFAVFEVTHDNNISDLAVGQRVEQGQVFYQEGTAGNATGNHVHMELGRGRYTGSGWYQNSYGIWTINNGYVPWNAYTLPEDIIIINGLGYPWKKDEEIVKPTQQQVQDTFLKYLGKGANDQAQIDYYVNRDVRVLYGDILGTTTPDEKEVLAAFKEFLPNSDDPNAVPYYTNNPKSLLYSNIAGALKGELIKAQNKPPVTIEVPVERIVEKEVIKEVVKGDDERSLGDLLSAAFKKLFKIK